MGKLKLPWHYGEDAVLINNDVLYQIPYTPNSKAEEIMNEKAPLPIAPPGEPGVVVQADGSTKPLTAKEVAALKTEVYHDQEWWEQFEADLDSQYAKEAAEAVATDVFQSLPLVPGAATGSEYFLKPPRSEQEIVNLLKAQGVPHVVQLVGRTKDELVLQAAGKDLSRGWIEGENPDETPASTRRSWAVQLATALTSLHGRGIFHRDITLMNALFSGETATLCDLECGPTSKPIIAPEVIVHGNEAFTDKSDIWAYGILLWSIENLNNPRPFAARYFERTGQFGPLIDKCLQVDPTKRPTAAEVARLLRDE